MAPNPAFPDLEVEPSEPSEIPDSVINSVLNQWGYGERIEDEPEADPAVPEVLETPETETANVEPDLAPVEPAAEVDLEPDLTEPDDVPVPPGGPVFDVEGAETTAPAPAPSTSLPPEWAQLQARIQTDPQFRQGLADLLNPQPAAPAPAPTSTLPALPRLSEEDLQEPAVQALLILAEHQRQQIEQVKQQVADTQRQTQVRQYQDTSEIANGAASQFKTTYNLPDEIMSEVRDIAGRSNAMHLYMAGVDPRTGKQVQPDPYKAVESALEMAYWNSPRARVFEIERQTAQRNKTSVRKQKLAGVGGSSGSASRAPVPFDLKTEKGRHEAMVAEVRASMNADET
jgi:hypothetical protein